MKYLAAYSTKSESSPIIQSMLLKHGGSEAGYKPDVFQGKLLYGIWWVAVFSDEEEEIYTKTRQEIIDAGYKVDDDFYKKYGKNETAI